MRFLCIGEVPGCAGILKGPLGPQGLRASGPARWAMGDGHTRDSRAEQETRGQRSGPLLSIAAMVVVVAAAVLGEGWPVGRRARAKRGEQRNLVAACLTGGGNSSSRHGAAATAT